MVPQFEAQEVRHSLHPVRAIFRQTKHEEVMVVDRSGSHRAHKRVSTLAHWQEQCRWHVWPAPCGHHRNPSEGFWRVMQDRMSAGRWFPDLPQLSQRTRRVLMAQQEQPL